MLFELLKTEEKKLSCMFVDSEKAFMIMFGEKHGGLNFYLTIIITKCMTVVMICTAKSSQGLCIKS